MPQPVSTSGPVAVIGAGPIGIGWTVVFARSGLETRVHDADPEVLAGAGRAVRDRLERLAGKGLLEDAVAEVTARISYADELEAAVAGAGYVQECVAERVEPKQELARRVHDIVPDAVLASSSSSITTTAMAAELPRRAHCLVAHPANPPYLLPAVEVVPAPFTATHVVRRTVRLLTTVGMRPVVLGREVAGFVMNRLQGAMLREAYCLVRDEVVSVEDLDTLVRDGVGRRWAFSGPFETADLNTVGGISAHAERLGPAYHRMGLERGQDDPWTPGLVRDVVEQRRAVLPLEDWAARTVWRDEMLMELSAVRAHVSQARAPMDAVPAPVSDARV